MIAPRNPANQPAYLTDHGQAVVEIATLLARVIWCTDPAQRDDPLTDLELAVLAAQAAQLPSVQCAADRLGHDPR